MLKIYQVDAFTTQAFAGNPAAVCVLTREKPDAWLQAVAKEMNLSETAFLLPQQDGYQLRWFTPTTEVDICGHATLASAHVLWTEGFLGENQIANFHTKSGLLTAQLAGKWIELNFPAEPPTKTVLSESMAEALKLHPTYCGKSIYYLLEVASEELVRSIQPDFELLRRATDRGVIVTSRSAGKEYDFVSRFFDPVDGINEDPVTGSAHCVLGPYWGELLNKVELKAYQASERGGSLKLNLAGERVILAGQAVTVFRGELLD